MLLVACGRALSGRILGLKGESVACRWQRDLVDGRKGATGEIEECDYLPDEGDVGSNLETGSW